MLYHFDVRVKRVLKHLVIFLGRFRTMFGNIRVARGQLFGLPSESGRKSSENGHTVVISVFMFVRMEGNYCSLKDKFISC